MSAIYKKFLSPEEKPFTLNITSMTDMFTILLVFLLQSFSAQTIALEPPSGLNSPQANLSQEMDNRDTIFISQTDVLWQKGQLLKREELNDPSKRTQATGILKDWITKNPGKRIQLMADKNTSYSEIKQILGMAAGAQIGEIRLVTLKAEKTP